MVARATLLLMTWGIFQFNHVQAQESGVKISLTLTPSKPEKPVVPATPAEEVKKTAPAPETKAVQHEERQEADKAEKRSPFALSSYEIKPPEAQKTDVVKNKPVDESDATSKRQSAAQKDVQQDKVENGLAPNKSDKNRKSEDPNEEFDLASSVGKARGAVPQLKSVAGGGKSNSVEKLKPLKPEGKQVKDKDDNEDAAECPGGAEGDQVLKLPDDVPLEQEDHPYDAPAAESLPTKPVRPSAPRAIGFTAEQLRLRNEINQCLAYYLQHPEAIARRSPWAVMHAILPYGVEAELISGNRRVNAIGWMCYNGICKTQRIFQPTKTGFRTNLGPGVQGHEGQFLAILAQSGVPANYPIKVGNRSYRVNDLVRYEMATCREDSELTFKLIGLSNYLEPNQQWRDNRGVNWTLDKIVAEELEQPIVGAACGGTHRLMGLTYSLMQHKHAGLPVDGHWHRAEQYLNDFVQYALTLQNADGSFSTEWFEGRGSDPKLERKVQTTGHILEWLVFTLPDNQLESPQVQKSIRFLLDTIGADPARDWPIGPRGHSLRALALYNQRVFGAPTGSLKKHLANLKSESYHR